ncbi:guanylate kinase [Mycoplasma elephantis]|uniref:guanylate kinase n=1 Tax=Mycoplasma elephantis TaxID=114882 RepID=UPI000489F169|nr:guanylate kinase [Mycoplasma elephantis]
MTRKVVVFCGPSGVGKGTIESILFKNENLKLKLSVSATSRSPRDREINGVHYFFISQNDFKEKIKNNEFLEWSRHFENYYGTLKSQIKSICDNGLIPFLEIETNGAKQVININNATGDFDLITIFLHAPDMKELERRIRGRNTETNEVILQRLEKAKKEIGESVIFQYHVINHTPEQAASEIEKIILNHGGK